MPHVMSNIRPTRSRDHAARLVGIHAAAITSGIAEPVAVRTRLKRREHFRVGDGSPQNAFVHIDSARSRAQPRTEETCCADVYDQANKTSMPCSSAPLALTSKSTRSTRTRLIARHAREQPSPHEQRARHHKIPRSAPDAPARPRLHPPFNIVRSSLSSSRVRSRQSRAFYVIARYIVSDEGKEALYLRGVEERNHHSVVLRESKDIVALAIGFKVASEQDLDKAAEWLSARKLPVSWPNVPFQGRTLRTVDPVGMPLDLYFKMDRVPSMLQKYAAYKGARIQRIDHINCFTPDVQASYDFYTELGFRLTETTETEGADPKLWAVWMQRRGSTHDLAFTNGRGPRLHHIGVWNANALTPHTCDVMATSGYLANMERGPGRTASQRLLPLRARSRRPPRRAFTSDYSPWIPITSRSAGLDDPQRQTLWGHPAPKSWFEEGSPFKGVPVREPCSKQAEVAR